VFFLEILTSILALILGGDFYTGAVLSSAIAKLVIRCAEISKDKQRVNSLKAEAMLIMVSVIRVGQSKFVTVPIDEDSNERIMNCIQTLSDLEKQSAVREIFLTDTKAAYSKMIVAQEVRDSFPGFPRSTTYSGFTCRKRLPRRKPPRRRKRRRSKSMIC